MIYIDYRNAVMRDYEQKRTAGTLSLELMHPSPARLRTECVKVLLERFDRGDDRSLRAFFGPVDNQENFIKRVDDWNTDDFRPLVNFLKKLTFGTEQKNLELLAWLIDFKPRPYSAEARLPSLDEASQDSVNGDPVRKTGKVSEIDEKAKETEDAAKTGARKGRKPWLKRAAMIAAVIFPVSVGWYGISGGMLTGGDDGGLPQHQVKIEKNVTRCQALTAKGLQCKRTADSAGYCWQHLRALKG